MSLPTVVTSAGLQPQSPASLRAQLLAGVSALVPGYTANLPGSLIEDIASTDVGAITLCDSARVELVNSLTPYGSNNFILNQLGQIYGPVLGQATNTSVSVIFTGTPGFVIAPGFTISDGSYQYVVQDGGIIQTGGSTTLLSCIATQTGTWAVPANTVTTLITSVPGSVTLSVTNPSAGVPSTGAETWESYRSRVLQAGLVGSQGMGRALKTALQNIPGVSSRLVSVRQMTNQWEVIVGGGDAYAVGYAIWQALFDISTLVGSVMNVTNITQANPGVVTTGLNHGFTTGQIITLSGVLGMTAVNGPSYTITVLSETTFSLGVNTSGYGAYTSGGVVSPNLRNTLVSINEYPDTYNVPYVQPPQQVVEVTITWNTTLTGFTSAQAVGFLGQPAVVDYVNSIPVGAPINVLELEDAFKTAIAPVLSGPQLTRLIVAVSINGIGVSPVAGTVIIEGDPESYFYILPTAVVISQG